MKYITGEKWVKLPGHKTAYGEHYAISNYGRLVKCKETPKDGSVLKCSRQEGYPIWRTRKKGQNYAVLIHRLVAKYFLPRPQRNEKVVIHHNHKKTDNHYHNLAWATIQEASVHAQGSPLVKKARRLMKEQGNFGNYKLTIDKVKMIKALLAKGKTLKEIAAKFNVSDMQIHRIKKGENWVHVK